MSKPFSIDQPAIRGERVTTVLLPAEGLKPKIVDGYILQVASFRERERAENLSRQIIEKGFEAFVEQFAVGREISFRVRVGPFADLAAAQESAQEILVKSGHRVLILPLQSGREAG